MGKKWSLQAAVEVGVLPVTVEVVVDCLAGVVVVRWMRSTTMNVTVGLPALKSRVNEVHQSPRQEVQGRAAVVVAIMGARALKGKVVEEVDLGMSGVVFVVQVSSSRLPLGGKQKVVPPLMDTIRISLASCRQGAGRRRADKAGTSFSIHLTSPMTMGLISDFTEGILH